MLKNTLQAFRNAIKSFSPPVRIPEKYTVVDSAIKVAKQFARSTHRYIR